MGVRVGSNALLALGNHEASAWAGLFPTLSYPHRERSSPSSNIGLHALVYLKFEKQKPAPLSQSGWTLPSEWAGTGGTGAAFLGMPQVSLELSGHASFPFHLTDQWAWSMKATPLFYILVWPWLRLLWLRHTAAW